MPDLHRLPCYVLADTQEVQEVGYHVENGILRGRELGYLIHRGVTSFDYKEHPDDRIVQCWPLKRRSVIERGEISILQNDWSGISKAQRRDARITTGCVTAIVCPRPIRSFIQLLVR